MIPILVLGLVLVSRAVPGPTAQLLGQLGAIGAGRPGLLLAGAGSMMARLAVHPMR